jgi:hypothetical protein
LEFVTTFDGGLWVASTFKVHEVLHYRDLSFITNCFGAL